MFNALNKYSKLTCALAIGKANLQKQEQELRRDPDFVIATPGRIVDFNKNSLDIDFSSVEYLIFDEADKLLDMGFSAEIDEILSFTGDSNRQTLLFSATMDKGIEKLTKLCLKQPLRIEAEKRQVLNEKLQQEIIKLKNLDSVELREGLLVHLITTQL